MHPTLAKIEIFQEKWEAEREKLVTEFKENFNNFFSEIFKKYPKLNAFKFTAYTPYFNDGEACEFSVNDVYDVLTDDNEDFKDVYSYKGIEKEMIEEVLGEINEIIFAVDSSFYKESFGDHIEISVYRNKIETEDYSHD
jgi:hypothetical protein